MRTQLHLWHDSDAVRIKILVQITQRWKHDINYRSLGWTFKKNSSLGINRYTVCNHGYWARRWCMLSQNKAHTHTHTHTQHCTEQGQQWHQRTGQRLHCFFTNYVLPLSLSSLFPWHDRWTPVSEGLPYYCERPFGKEVKTKSDLVKLKGEGEKILWEVFCERNRKHQWMERSLWVPLTTFLFSLSVKPKLKP